MRRQGRRFASRRSGQLLEILWYALLAYLSVCVFFRKAYPAPPPPPGLTTTCKVLSVYDGDTVTCELRRTVRVRILGLDSPEIRTRDLEEKARGLAARDYLRSMIEGEEVILHIPAPRDGSDLSDLFTFGRVLGHLYFEDSLVSERMITGGHGEPR